MCLLIHEFIGHGLPVIFFDGRVLSVVVSYFGKAWVQFNYSPNPSFLQILSVSLGGILIELILACIMFMLCRYVNKTHLKFYCIVAASLFLIHSMSYLALSLHLGHADGDVIYRYTSESTRNVLAIVVACVAVCFSYLCSYHYSAYIHALSKWRSRLTSMLIFIFAMSIAGLLSLALMLLEESFFKEGIREEIFTAKYVEELATVVEKEQIKLQRPLNIEELKVIENKVKPYPLPLYMGLGMFVAGMIGYLKHKEVDCSNFSIESINLKMLFSVSLFIVVLISSLSFKFS